MGITIFFEKRVLIRLIILFLTLLFVAEKSMKQPIRVNVAHSRVVKQSKRNFKSIKFVKYSNFKDLLWCKVATFDLFDSNKS